MAPLTRSNPAHAPALDAAFDQLVGLGASPLAPEALEARLRAEVA
jgi:hypothetical protein